MNERSAAVRGYEWDREADEKLFNSLLSGDKVAWEVFYRDVISPIVRSRKFSVMLLDYGIDPYEVMNQVFLTLTCDNYSELRKYRLEGKLRNWMYHQVRGVVKTLISRKRGKHETTETDLSENGDGITLEEMTQGTEEFLGLREELNMTFGELWHENPMRAYVFMLRAVSGLSAKEVADMLSLEGANVDQIYRRACISLREKMVKKHIEEA